MHSEVETIKTNEHNLIVIEGVVGVGKTSLMEILMDKGYIMLPEGVEDNPILDKFYYNRERYAFSLQIYLLNKRFEQVLDAERLGDAVMDRSIYGDAIFAKMLNESRELSDEEYNIFIELLNNMLRFVKSPKLLIYLEASTDEAIKRINMRGRNYEKEVEYEYWDKLNEEYSIYFDNYTLSPMLRINVDGLDFKNNPLDREYLISLIDDKLEELEEW